MQMAASAPPPPCKLCVLGLGEAVVELYGLQLQLRAMGYEALVVAPLLAATAGLGRHEASHVAAAAAAAATAAIDRAQLVLAFPDGVGQVSAMGADFVVQALCYAQGARKPVVAVSSAYLETRADADAAALPPFLRSAFAGRSDVHKVASLEAAWPVVRALLSGLSGPSGGALPGLPTAAA